MFREHGAALSADGIASCIGRDRSWFLDRFEGRNSALDRIERIRCEAQGPREEMTDHECGADVHADRLERSPTTTVIHTFIERLHRRISVLAGQYPASGPRPGGHPSRGAADIHAAEDGRQEADGQ
ncbi:MAG: hypothetical protein V5A43_03715 [Haloarculaceae archaeon]